MNEYHQVVLKQACVHYFCAVRISSAHTLVLICNKICLTGIVNAEDCINLRATKVCSLIHLLRTPNLLTYTPALYASTNS